LEEKVVSFLKKEKSKMKFWLIFIVSALFAVDSVNSIWIGEEYWSIINYDGSIYGGRSINDFIRFKGSEDRFVAYWITQGARVATVVRDECYDLIHDTNGDGIVDSKEHHNCRYGKNVCPISVYDFNKDGLLDEDEINECLKHLKSRPVEVRAPRQSSTVVINNGNDNQFEAYGEAYIRGDRICAKFVDKDDKATEICGGFRVLSRGSHDGANPFEWYPIREISRHMAVEYLNHQISQIWNGDRLESVFGGAHLDRQLAYAAFLNNTVLHVGRSSDPHFYDTNIDLLALKDGYFPKQYIHTGPERARRYGTVFTPDDLYSNLRRPAAVPTDECYNLIHDTNGDGIVDSREHHACRYKKYGCPISVYDFNKDGLLDEDEINECLKHLKSGAPLDYRNPRTPAVVNDDECLNLRHDKNADGYINSEELRACRYGIPRCTLSVYDSNNDGFLDWNEIEECQRRLPSDRFARFISAPSKNECSHPRHDRNGDGKIDRHELHICRYGLIGCNLQIYDLDKDGFLNAYEIDECQKQLAPEHRIPVYQPHHHNECYNLKYDKNGDGIIDKNEYHSCKYGHCSLEIYDLDKDGILNSYEIAECQKRLVHDRHPYDFNDCHHLRNDKNGDGIVDKNEVHACRYRLIGCNLEIYDLDKDGLLNSHETSECYRHLKTERFVRYCQDLYFDLNKDGIVDTYELEKCLNRHDPIRRRLIRSHEIEEEEEANVEEVHEQKEEITEEEVQEESVQKQEEEILDEKKQEIQELNEEAKAEKRKNKSEEDESDE
jgi:hypothetical protein